MSMASSRAGEESKQTVLETLRRLRRPCTTLELATALGKKRSEINPFLYDLQKQGLIKKVQESSPPKWDLVSDGVTYHVRKSGISDPAARRGRGRGRGLSSMAPPTNPGFQGMQQRAMQSHSPFQDSSAADQRHSPGSGSENRRKIVQVLRNAIKPMTALEVSHAIGLKSRSEVNPDLYAMEKEGVVTKSSESGPPVWKLACEPAQMETDSSSSSSSHLHQDEMMEVQTAAAAPSVYTSSRANLSVIPEGDLRQRLLAVLSDGTDIQRTELELLKATGSKCPRSELKAMLESLHREELVAKTHTIPTKWWIRSGDSGDRNSSGVVPQSLMPHITPGGGGGGGVGLGSTDIPMATAPPISSPASLPGTFSASVVNEMNRNPISSLTEHCQAEKLDLSFIEVREFGPPHKKHFVIAAQIEGQRYEAESTNKKEARRMAADLALQAIRQQQAVSMPTAPLVTSTNSGMAASAVAATAAVGAVANSTFADKIAAMVHTYYTQLQASLEQAQPGRKVIAAFVMEDSLSGSMTVVAVGSGTRCITGDHMSLEGIVVNDSHAEVIARRSLMRFFYKELFAHRIGGGVDTIFDDTDQHDLLRVRENLKFHLYISTAPCGDGAQFSRGDDQNRDPPPGEVPHNPTMQNKQQGVLRTKMEGGEGTIPIGSDTTPLTWDGILQGGRLRTMSCSDKVARWNVLGLQGALLSLFMAPVYMSSLTLGSLHHHGHLSRAVCCRLAELTSHQDLPGSYKVNHPCLGRVQGGDEMRRHTEKTNNLSLNWAAGDDRAELIDGGNGRPVLPLGVPKSQMNCIPSRVAKIQLYAEFLKLARLHGQTELLAARCYKEAKEMATPYQTAKGLLYRYCEARGYGKWMRKPVEEEQFDSSVLERLEKSQTPLLQ